jgi:putative flippase GtrA
LTGATLGRIIVNMKDLIKKFADRTFLRFVLVGVINTLFGTAVMFVFYNVFGLSYWLSSASNYFFGSILSYFLNKYYTFRYKKRSWRIVGRFAINISVCYLIAYGIAKPLIASLMSGFAVAAQENAAMLCGMCLFVVLNYLGQRFFAFRQDKEEEKDENQDNK